MRNENAKVSDPKSFVTCAGDRYHINYAARVMDNGEIELVESGKDDIQEMIDSYRDQTDIRYIISRIQMGDTSVLNQKTPMYGDFTKMPTTQAEVLQLMIDAHYEFDHLPVDVKKKYENDFNRWFTSIGTEEWFKDSGYNVAKDEEITTESFEDNKEISK